MQLHGSTEANLISALSSASRLRGQRVHADTVKFWRDLVLHAQRELSANAFSPSSLIGLVAALELELKVFGPPPNGLRLLDQRRY